MRNTLILSNYIMYNITKYLVCNCSKMRTLTIGGFYEKDCKERHDNFFYNRNIVYIYGRTLQIWMEIIWFFNM